MKFQKTVFREKKNRTSGFTLAELLIVVAIIAVLVAISIPIFNGRLEISREATDLANIRSAYAEVMVQAVEEESGTYSKTVGLKQQVNGWKTDNAQATLEGLAGGASNVQGTPQKGGSAQVTWQNGTLKIIFGGSVPVALSEDDLTNMSVMNEKYGQIVSALGKTFDMKRMDSRYDYCGEGETDADKVKIFTVQTGDGQSQKEIKDAMKEVGYSDAEINAFYGKLHYAYLDEDHNLLGYHGPGSGGASQLYVVGYDENPISVGGAIEARNALAEFVQKGTITK